MNINEMHIAIDEAERSLRYADKVAGRLAAMLKGRLRNVESAYALTQLKRELRDWDMHRQCWKEHK